ncbi:MAG: sortase [Clostridiales bacterium]|nr:sortase [Clostridiales bacterium]
MRYKLGVSFMILGTTLILAAMSLFLYNKAEAWRAESEAAKAALVLNEYIENNEYLTDVAESSVEIDGSEYIGILSVPQLGLELPVMSEWSYSGLKKAPGRYSGDVLSRDLVICGHNYERHFGKLKSLNKGDSVIFTDVKGKEFAYRVEETVLLKPVNVEEMVNDESNRWDLTLFTCTANGRARVTLRCILADEDR